MGPNYGIDKGFVVDPAATVANVAFGRAVKFGTSNTQITSVTATTDQPIGVSQMTLDSAKVATGKATLDVRMIGLSRCIAGASFSRGVRLTIDNQGRVVAAAPGAGTNVGLVGLALSPASAAGDQVDVLLMIGSTFQG
jgi:hypothetical protein